MKKRVIATILCMLLAAEGLTNLSGGNSVYAAEKTDKSNLNRVIITTDLECDDMNSLIHLSLFFNDVDLDGIVLTSSQFHFSGDGGQHTLAQINSDYACEDASAATLTSYRPAPENWINQLWQNEYAASYRYLVQNDPDYPTPDELSKITKIGNIEFEGDVRYDTEGSNLIKAAILDNDERKLYLMNWGGFNTVARALLSIADDYKNTAQWEEIRQKIYNKVIISGYGQDNTYKDYIVSLYPDLKLMDVSDGYAGYFTAKNAQENVRYTFQSAWLKKNIKFDHGSLMNKYGLMDDGTVYEGEPAANQYGLTKKIDWGFMKADFDQYDFLAEGDSSGFMALIPVGLAGLSNRFCDTLAGSVSYVEPDFRSMAEKMTQTSTNAVYNNYNAVTGENSDSTEKYLLAYQQEWAARADWCVKGYDYCNHAPVINVSASNLVVTPGEVIKLAATVTDPDNDSCSAYWNIDPYKGSYSGDSKNLTVWDPVELNTAFTVPKDAKSGDTFVITLTVKDHADAPMTRYAQLVATVKK